MVRTKDRWVIAQRPPFCKSFFLVPRRPSRLSLLISFPIMFPLLRVFPQFPLFSILSFTLLLPYFPRCSLLSSFLLSSFRVL